MFRFDDFSLELKTEGAVPLSLELLNDQRSDAMLEIARSDPKESGAMIGSLRAQIWPGLA